MADDLKRSLKQMLNPTRRDALKGAGMAVGHQKPSFNVAQPLADLALGADVTTIDTKTFNAAFLDRMEHVLEEAMVPLYDKEDLEKRAGDPLYQFGDVRRIFEEKASGLLQLLGLDKDERAALFRTKMFKDLQQENAGNLTYQSYDLLEDQQILKALKREWDFFTIYTDQVLPVLDRAYVKENNLNYMDGLDWANILGANGSPMGAEPDWYKKLDGFARMMLRTECDRAHNGMGATVGAFPVDDDQLVQLLKYFLPEDMEKAGVFTVPPKSLFLEYYGPRSWRKRFVRAHELSLRAGGASAEVARSQAQKKLQDMEEPPLVSVKRADDFLRVVNDAAYIVRLQPGMAPQQRAETLFKVFDHMSDEIKLTEKPIDYFRIKFIGDDQMKITVPKQSAASQVMDDCCNKCFDWDEAWFKSRTTQLEAPQLREAERPLSPYAQHALGKDGCRL